MERKTRDKERERHRDRSREKRRERSKDKHKDRSKERRDRSKERREKEKREKKKREERKKKEKAKREIERLIQMEKRVQEIEVPQDDNDYFVFVYEDKDAHIYTNLFEINSEDGEEINIFPVYFTGGNENLNGETIVWSVQESKYVTKLENPEESWLNIIRSTDEKTKVNIYDGQDIIVYNDKFFYSQQDLYDYLEAYGAEVLPIYKEVVQEQ